MSLFSMTFTDAEKCSLMLSFTQKELYQLFLVI